MEFWIETSYLVLGFNFCPKYANKPNNANKPKGQNTINKAREPIAYTTNATTIFIYYEKKGLYLSNMLGFVMYLQFVSFMNCSSSSKLTEPV